MKKYFNIIIGSILIGLSFNLFILPFDLVSSGVFGLSNLLFYATNYEPALFIFIVNFGLIIISLVSFGYNNTKKYIIPSLLIPITIYLSKDIVNYVDIFNIEKILIVIVGAFLTGTGYSFIYKEGYSAGGLLLLQDLLNSIKVYRKKTFSYIVESIIILLTAIILDFETALYSTILIVIINYLGIKTKLGISSSKTFFIITTKEEEIKNYIMNELHHDLTEINVKGGFTNKKNKILMTAIDTKDYYKLKEGLKLLDPKIFISIVDSYEVINKNKTIKEKLEK